MNVIEQLEQLLSSLIESNSGIRADDGDWDIQIERGRGVGSIPSGVVILANNGCGDMLFIDEPDPPVPVLNSKVYVFRHEDGIHELFADTLGELLHPPPPIPTDFQTVYYHGGREKVELGDEVVARDLLRRRTGRVTYLPGVSKKNREFEHDGLAWIGITFDSGSISGSYIDPQSNWVKESVRFKKRSKSPFQEIGPYENLDE